MVLPVWKAKTSMSLLIDKREKSMLSLRTFGEDIVKAPENRDAKLGKQATEVPQEETPVIEGEQDEEEAVANAPALGVAEDAAVLAEQ